MGSLVSQTDEGIIRSFFKEFVDLHQELLVSYQVANNRKLNFFTIDGLDPALARKIDQIEDRISYLKNNQMKNLLIDIVKRANVSSKEEAERLINRIISQVITADAVEFGEKLEAAIEKEKAIFDKNGEDYHNNKYNAIKAKIDGISNAAKDYVSYVKSVENKG